MLLDPILVEGKETETYLGVFFIDLHSDCLF